MRRLKDYMINCVSAVALAAAATACNADLRELCYDHNHQEARVRVSFDWSAVPGDPSPASMALTVFAKGAQPVETAFHGRDGGIVSLLPYTYSFAAFNDDGEALFHQGSTWEEFEIYAQRTDMTRLTRMFTRSASVPLARGTEDQPVILEPDPLWTAAQSTTEVTVDRENTLLMTMENAITEYTFRIENVENLSYAVELLGTLSGMSGSWLPALHHGSSTHCVLPVTLEGDGSELVGRVRTFGHCYGEGDDHSEHLLTIYAEMKDGSKVYITTDVTEAMHDADHTDPVDGGSGHTEIPIVIDQLPLPKPITNGSGLQPAVSEWQEVEISIPMGEWHAY